MLFFLHWSITLVLTLLRRIWSVEELLDAWRANLLLFCWLIRRNKFLAIHANRFKMLTHADTAPISRQRKTTATCFQKSGLLLVSAKQTRQHRPRIFYSLLTSAPVRSTSGRKFYLHRTASFLWHLWLSHCFGVWDVRKTNWKSQKELYFLRREVRKTP